MSEIGPDGQNIFNYNNNENQIQRYINHPSLLVWITAFFINYSDMKFFMEGWFLFYLVLYFFIFSKVFSLFKSK